MDLESGFYCIAMDIASQKFTAFFTEYGLFEWTRLPMGLKNSGATFQKAMTELFKEFIGKFIYVYMDDFIVFSRSAKEHKKHLKKVIDILKAAEMRIKLKKCMFFQREIEFLGYLIKDGTMRPSPRKVEALFRYEEPATLRQLLSFLGLSSYYRKFVEKFIEIAHTLYECIVENKNNKGKLKNWTKERLDAFNTLRTYLTNYDKVLLLPDLEKIFKLFCDSSFYGIGACLSQQDKNNEWRPCSYFSKHLSKTERNYSVAEKELLSCVKGTEFNKQFLIGKEFILVTDHQPL